MINQVQTWLNEQGFPLEMRTASAFRGAGFEVNLSGLYTDQETRKTREIDVLAFYPDHVGVTKIALVVECKSSKKPWLLLCDPEVLAGRSRVHSFATVNENAARAMNDEQVFKPLLNECPWFSKDDLTGYSLRSAFSEKDAAYEATTSVAKACMDFVDSAKAYQQCFAFPVIVVDSPLVRCSLNDAQEVHCEEVTQGDVFFKYGLERPFRTCIRVVTQASLADFANRAWEVADFVRFKLADAEVKLWNDHFFPSTYPADLRRHDEEASRKRRIERAEK